MAEAGALEKQGWSLSEDGIKECTENGNKSTQAILKAALDFDLKQIGKPSLPDGLSRAKQDVLEGPCVLQIQKVRNVSAPKDNEESGGAPQFLRLTLTDGFSNCSALGMERIDKLGLDTPPGTKIKLTGKIPMSNGFLLLSRSGVNVLGGRVEKLIENWQLKRELAKLSRFAETTVGGPPPFVPFGQRYKVPRDDTSSRGRRDNFKSLDNKNEAKKEDAEFEQQRQATIAEVMKDKGEVNKKSFGAGSLVKPNDKDIAQIVSMGFSPDEASSALKSTNNNVEQAINNLLNKPYEDASQRGFEGRGRGGRSAQFNDRPGRADRNDRTDRAERPDRGRGKKRQERDGEDYEASSKPSAPASLFDFLKTKIPAKEENISQKASAGYPSHTNSARASDQKDRQLPPRLAKQNSEQGRAQGRSDRPSQRSFEGDSFGQRHSYNNQFDNNYDQRRRDYGQEKEQRQYTNQGPRGREDYKSNNSRSGSQTGDSKFNRGGRENSYHDQGDRSNRYQGNRQQNERSSGSQNDKRQYDRPYKGQGQGDQFSAEQRRGRNNQYNADQNDRSFRNGNDDSSQQSRNRTNQRSTYNQQRVSQNPSENRNQTSSDEQYYKNKPHVGQSQSTQRDRQQTEQSTGGRQEPTARKSNNPKSAQVSVADVQRKMAEVTINSPENSGVVAYTSHHVSQQSQHRPPQPSPAMQYNQPQPQYQRQWREGDVCLAKYWEDNQYYHAQIHAIAHTGQTCVVTFSEYGNSEEVMIGDIRPLPASAWGEHPTGTTLLQTPVMMGPNAALMNVSPQMYPGNQPFMTTEPMQGNLGNMEFRRGGGGRSYPARQAGKPTQQYYVPPSHRATPQM